MTWKVLTVLLCLLSFVKEMRPSESFLTLYLEENKKITLEEIRQEIYPWWTYFFLVWIIPVFLLADFLRYKPIIIVTNAAAVGAWALLLWSEGKVAMKFAQVLYGLFTAGELVYYYYLFLEVPKEQMHKVSLSIKAASLSGKLISFVLSQCLYSFCVADLYDLHMFSFVSICGALFISFLIPRTKQSEIFHGVSTSVPNTQTLSRDSERDPGISDLYDSGYQDYMERENFMISGDRVQHSSSQNSYRYKFMYMLTGLKYVYRNEGVFVWSIWWALVVCGNFRIGNYVQNYWYSIDGYGKGTGCHHLILNGAVEAISSLLGALAVLLILCAPVKWSKRSELAMSILCALNSASLIYMVEHSELWPAYSMYALFRISYIAVVCIATVQLTLHLERQFYAVVFSCNMFISLVIETAMTVVVVDKAGLKLDITEQFTCYGVYFGVISIVFLLANTIRCFERSNYDELESSKSELCRHFPLLQNVR